MLYQLSYSRRGTDAGGPLNASPANILDEPRTLTHLGARASQRPDLSQKTGPPAGLHRPQVPRVPGTRKGSAVLGPRRGDRRARIDA
jgi:hypothetical protein